MQIRTRQMIFLASMSQNRGFGRTLGLMTIAGRGVLITRLKLQKQQSQTSCIDSIAFNTFLHMSSSV